MKKMLAISMCFMMFMFCANPIQATAYTKTSTEVLDWEFASTGLNHFYYTPYLESVGKCAFSTCGYLTQFRTEAQLDPNNQATFKLNYIGDYAFAGCANLNVLDLTTVSYIGDFAMFGCTELVGPNTSWCSLPKGLEHIGAYAIGYYGNLDVNKKDEIIRVSGIQQYKNVIIRVSKGSVGEKYAKENLFSYQYGNENFIVGDFNADGMITLDDIQEMLASYVDHVSGKKQSVPNCTVRNDLNNDNKSDISDVQMLLRYYTETTIAGKSDYTWFDLRKDMGMV